MSNPILFNFVQRNRIHYLLYYYHMFLRIHINFATIMNKKHDEHYPTYMAYNYIIMGIKYQLVTAIIFANNA